MWGLFWNRNYRNVTALEFSGDIGAKFAMSILFDGNDYVSVEESGSVAAKHVVKKEG